jgi:hypothetical protein
MGRFARRTEAPGETAGIMQRLGGAEFSENVMQKLRLQGGDGTIESGLADMVALPIGEDAVLGQEFGDRGALAHGVMLAEDLVEVAPQ